jgi:hypothetical protein
MGWFNQSFDPKTCLVGSVVLFFPFAVKAQGHLSFARSSSNGSVPGLLKQLTLAIDVGLNDFRIVEGECQRIEDFRWAELRIAPQDGLDLGAVAKEGVDAANWYARTIDVGATPEHCGLDANVGMWNEYDG